MAKEGVEGGKDRGKHTSLLRARRRMENAVQVPLRQFFEFFDFFPKVFPRVVSRRLTLCSPWSPPSTSADRLCYSKGRTGREKQKGEIKKRIWERGVQTPSFLLF